MASPLRHDSVSGAGRHSRARDVLNALRMMNETPELATDDPDTEDVEAAGLRPQSSPSAAAFSSSTTSSSSSSPSSSSGLRPMGEMHLAIDTTKDREAIVRETLLSNSPGSAQASLQVKVRSAHQPQSASRRAPGKIPEELKNKIRSHVASGQAPRTFNPMSQLDRDMAPLRRQFVAEMSQEERERIVQRMDNRRIALQGGGSDTFTNFLDLAIKCRGLNPDDFHDALG